MQIVGFDCVDDESKPEVHPNQGIDLPAPKDWTTKQDPPYSYWCYYLYANIKALNDFREERGEWSLQMAAGGACTTCLSMCLTPSSLLATAPPYTGMSTFEFRPHCGEAGDPEHLVAAYLVADKINHGIVLRKSPGQPGHSLARSCVQGRYG